MRFRVIDRRKESGEIVVTRALSEDPIWTINTNIVSSEMLEAVRAVLVGQTQSRVYLYNGRTRIATPDPTTLWETPCGSNATGAAGQEGDTTDQRAEESHGNAAGDVGKPNETEASSTTQTADALETANQPEPEVSTDARRKSRKKKSET